MEEKNYTKTFKASFKLQENFFWSSSILNLKQACKKKKIGRHTCLCIFVLSSSFFPIHSRVTSRFVALTARILGHRCQQVARCSGSRFHCFTRINYSPADIMKNNDGGAESARATDTCSGCRFVKEESGSLLSASVTRTLLPLRAHLEKKPHQLQKIYRWNTFQNECGQCLFSE